MGKISFVITNKGRIILKACDLGSHPAVLAYRQNSLTLSIELLLHKSLCKISMMLKAHFKCAQPQQPPLSVLIKPEKVSLRLPYCAVGDEPSTGLQASGHPSPSTPADTIIPKSTMIERRSNFN